MSIKIFREGKKNMLRLYGRYRVGGLIGSLMRIPYDGRTSEDIKLIPKSRTITLPSSDSKKSKQEESIPLSAWGCALSADFFRKRLKITNYELLLIELQNWKGILTKRDNQRFKFPPPILRITNWRIYELPLPPRLIPRIRRGLRG